MADNEPVEDVDVTKAWAASETQKGKAKKLRLFAAISWVIAIGTEIAAIVLILKKTFNEGGLALLIGLFVVIGIFAIAGSIMWKKANRHDPASKSEPAKFFIQNQLGAIITIIAFVPLLAMIFLDKDMDPKTKKIAGGFGAVLALIATFVFGADYSPPSTEQYTQDMNECAAQIKAKQPTTACSPAVAEQAQDIAKDSEAVEKATGGQDVVYWIAPKNGAEKSSSKLVFHLCENVSTLRGKTVNSGSVTEAYAQNAVRLTKQIKMEQRQCGFEPAE
ncbi:hypothetical protein N9W89_09985 [Hellea sp.]|nr:hypothetical protein [Hellea sp.]